LYTSPVSKGVKGVTARRKAATCEPMGERKKNGSTSPSTNKNRQKTMTLRSDGRRRGMTTEKCDEESFAW
jgi:hypothetical protein